MKKMTLDRIIIEAINTLNEHIPIHHDQETGRKLMAYFSNGSAGELLDEQCGNCKIGIDNPCSVALVQFLFNYDQLKEGNDDLKSAMNILVNDKGICQMKLMIDKVT